MRKRINFKHAKNNLPKKTNYHVRDKEIKITHAEVQKTEIQDNHKQEIKQNHQKNMLANFVNAINFGFLHLRKTREHQIQDFLNNVISDFSISFEKIKKIYERERN